MLQVELLCILFSGFITGIKKKCSLDLIYYVIGLNKVMDNFFRRIPTEARIISISVLGQSYARLLQAFFRLRPCPDVCFLLSCLKYEETPIVLFISVYKMSSKGNFVLIRHKIQNFIAYPIEANIKYTSSKRFIYI